MILQKPCDRQQYAQFALECNECGLVIEDKGIYFEGVNPPPMPPLTSEEIRAERDRLLADTDKFMVADFPITEAEREQYLQYRQYLRDLPQAVGFPDVEILGFEEWKKQ